MYKRKFEAPIQVSGLLMNSSHTYDYQIRNDTLRAELIPNIVWQTT